MITRDNKGCITRRALISVSVILYKSELIKYISQLNNCIWFGKELKTFIDFQNDFLVSQRNLRKQRSINKHKKAQLLW